MEASNLIQMKVLILLVVLISASYYIVRQTNRYGLIRILARVHLNLNGNRLLDRFDSISSNNTSSLINSTMTTRTTDLPTTLDPAELLVERPPSALHLKSDDFNGAVAVFVSHTKNHVLARFQLHLIRKLTMNLVAIEVFTDGIATQEMHRTASEQGARLFSFSPGKHPPRSGPSDRNTHVVNWAISERAKRYLGNGTAILLLDGDVFPLSPFDAKKFLNSRDLVCRKHPALFSRYCWIGFICLSPRIYSTIDDFDVSQTTRNQRSYDSGGKTVEYLLKYENTSFSWMKETILTKADPSLFWGAIYEDTKWIERSFSRCDKCGPEIFFSPFNASDAVFYHMISATSQWRFGHLGSRLQVIHDSIMRSPYGPNKNYSKIDMMVSVRKIQKMEPIPYYGNLTCNSVCKG